MQFSNVSIVLSLGNFAPVIFENIAFLLFHFTIVAQFVSVSNLWIPFMVFYMCFPMGYLYKRSLEENLLTKKKCLCFTYSSNTVADSIISVNICWHLFYQSKFTLVSPFFYLSSLSFPLSPSLLLFLFVQISEEVWFLISKDVYNSHKDYEDLIASFEKFYATRKLAQFKKKKNEKLVFFFRWADGMRGWGCALSSDATSRTAISLFAHLLCALSLFSYTRFSLTQF